MDASVAISNLPSAIPAINSQQKLSVPAADSTPFLWLLSKKTELARRLHLRGPGAVRLDICSGLCSFRALRTETSENRAVVLMVHWLMVHWGMPRSQMGSTTEIYRNADSTVQTNLPGVELLLVDDEDDFRDSAAEFFIRRGHNVTSVRSGREAIQACR